MMVQNEIADEESDSSSAELFEVEKIVAERKRQGKSEFLIKWRGYHSADNSWEPEENLIGCENAIKEYQATQKEIRINLRKRQQRQSRGSGQIRNKNYPEVTASSLSLKEEASKYRILHQIASPPISPSLVKSLSRYSEMKQVHEEKAPYKVDKRTMNTRKQSILVIFVGITLFVLLLLALVQPVGIRSQISSSSFT